MDDIVKRLEDRQICSIAQNGCLNDFRMDMAVREITRLRAQNAALVKALHFYAANHYPEVDSGPWGDNSADFGDVARAALAKVKG